MDNGEEKMIKIIEKDGYLMTPTKVTQYVTSDKREFSNKEQAEKHQNKLDIINKAKEDLCYSTSNVPFSFDDCELHKVYIKDEKDIIKFQEFVLLEAYIVDYLKNNMPDFFFYTIIYNDNCYDSIHIVSHKQAKETLHSLDKMLTGVKD
jgi:hypothetical protein